MAAAPLLRWGAARPAALARRLVVPGFAGLATVAGVGLLSRPGPAALAAFGCAASVLATTGQRLAGRVRAARRAGGGVALLAGRASGGLIAHAGIALVACGVAASSAYTGATERQISVGQVVTVQGVAARLEAVDRRGSDATMEVTARLALLDDGRRIGTAQPRLRFYPARAMTVSVPAIRSQPAGDVYATLTAASADGRSATIRLAVNPLVGLIWAGSALTALGGLLAAGRRATARLRRPATAAVRGIAVPEKRLPRASGQPVATPGGTVAGDPSAEPGQPVAVPGGTAGAPRDAAGVSSDALAVAGKPVAPGAEGDR
jgi:cytochrome c-type biogenesis protein CcmF